MGLKQLLFRGDNKIGATLALMLVSFAVLGCLGGGRESGKPVPSSFHGVWMAKDGTSLRITSDGTAHYKAGSTTVDGATAEINESGKKLSLVLFGFAVKEFTIDQMPSGGKMKLDGITFQGDDAADSDATATKGPGDFQEATGNKGESKSDVKSDAAGSVSTTDPDIPDKDIIDSLVSRTITDFSTAVATEDFTQFRGDVAEEFRSRYSAEEMKQAFKDFVDNKDKVAELLDSTMTMDPVYEPSPGITKQSGIKVLEVKGTYPTKPATRFEMQYKQDGLAWKLLKIKVNL